MEPSEARAERVLESVPPYVWDGESLPVPVEEIASTCFSLQVVDVEAEVMAGVPDSPALAPDQAFSGLLLAGPGQIWVNATEARRWPPRRRFTIGHELGHWVLHRDAGRLLFCRSTTVQPEERTRPDAPPAPGIEEEASAFAAALLMPAPLVRRHYRRDTVEFAELCEMFGASQVAMERRLRDVIRG
jgi:IrrE N-terminal-like domain